MSRSREVKPSAVSSKPISWSPLAGSIATAICSSSPPMSGLACKMAHWPFATRSRARKPPEAAVAGTACHHLHDHREAARRDVVEPVLPLPGSRRDRPRLTLRAQDHDRRIATFFWPVASKRTASRVAVAMAGATAVRN